MVIFKVNLLHNNKPLNWVMVMAELTEEGEATWQKGGNNLPTFDSRLLMLKSNYFLLRFPFTQFSLLIIFLVKEKLERRLDG